MVRVTPGDMEGKEARIWLVDKASGAEREIRVLSVGGRAAGDALECFEKIDELGELPRVIINAPELDVEDVLGQLSANPTNETPRDILSAEVQAAQDAVTVHFIEHGLADKQRQEVQSALDQASLSWMQDWLKKRVHRLEADVSKCAAVLQNAQQQYDDLRVKLVHSVAPEISATASDYRAAFQAMCVTEPEAVTTVASLVAQIGKDIKEHNPNTLQLLSPQTATKYFGTPDIDDPTDAKYLLGLMADARDIEGRLWSLARDLARTVERNGGICKAVRAPLKTLRRSLQKAKEEYGTDIRLLKDLARVGLEAREMSDVVICIKALMNLQAKGEIEFVRVKSRFSTSYDADEGGGYRDLLLNLALSGSEHIVEMQVHLHAFLAIKQGGGHAVYRTARQVHAFDTRTCVYEGSPSHSTLDKADRGVLRKLLINGANVPDDLKPRLGRCLQQPTARLVHLAMASCDLRADISEFIKPSTCLTLRRLGLSTTKTAGQIPPCISRLSALEYLALSNNSMTGPVPPEISGLISLRTLFLFNNRFTGKLPDQFSALKVLDEVDVTNNKFSGPISVGLCACAKLRKLWLFKNNFTGAVPAEMGNISALTDLQLSNNKLSQTLPESLGDLANLKTLYVHNNLLTGTLPASMSKLRRLTDIACSKNRMSGDLSTGFTEWTSLKKAMLHTNEWTNKEEFRRAMVEALPGSEVSC